MNYAIILSGGKGTRIRDINIPKQYYFVKNIPIIKYSIETFIKNENIDGLVIVASSEWHEFIKKLIEKETNKFIGFVEAGENRQRSIYNALVFLKERAYDDDIVIIHDSARPNVKSNLIDTCIENTKKCDGIMPVLPIKDTLYISESGNKIDALIDRNKLFAGQSPEAFKYGKYLKANERLMPNDILHINGSTEPAVLAGMNIDIIQGDENNYKITTKSDLDKFRKEKKDEGICT
ncbi:2-C-methyl-D-erythritol 4-phosphate cytidylyltransferase [Clostridium butyricum]|uniref:IspD/TarI family cytidylyltransferase n=1 Tax=Clostridium butyricum TaxID=1492 RepID=UPI001CAA3642|nr:IspD/TarI family cytidylyltransferase [Clostridium butyricum]MBZ0312905.1 2-C-methyl-D-erythritol 4-phosphate cytidylyltransferase [Clostridium butyricum]